MEEEDELNPADKEEEETEEEKRLTKIVEENLLNISKCVLSLAANDSIFRNLYSNYVGRINTGRGNNSETKYWIGWVLYSVTYCYITGVFYMYIYVCGLGFHTHY